MELILSFKPYPKDLKPVCLSLADAKLILIFNLTSRFVKKLNLILMNFNN